MVVYCVFDNVQILQNLGVLGLQCFGRASGDTARQKGLAIVVKHSVGEKLTLSDGHDCGRGQLSG